MADLEAHSFACYVRETGPHPLQFDDAAGQVVDFVPPTRFEFGCNSLEVLAMAAIQGLGVARLPSWLVTQAWADGTLLAVFEEPQPCDYALKATGGRSRSERAKCNF